MRSRKTLYSDTKIEDIFSGLIELISNGLTKQKACKQLGINRDWIYDHLNTEQLAEIDRIKRCNRNKKIHYWGDCFDSTLIFKKEESYD